MENFILVQKDRGLGVIISVIRSYESRSRATEDLDLMREMMPDSDFEVMQVEHIET